MKIFVFCVFLIGSYCLDTTMILFNMSDRETRVIFIDGYKYAQIWNWDGTTSLICEIPDTFTTFWAVRPESLNISGITDKIDSLYTEDFSILENPIYDDLIYSSTKNQIIRFYDPLGRCVKTASVINGVGFIYFGDKAKGVYFWKSESGLTGKVVRLK